MNLRHLEHLLAVIDTGSFSRAAEQHHITQSALSRSIQALEDELGLRLLDRLGKRNELTPFGHVVAERARRMLLDAAELRRSAQFLRQGNIGAIRVGLGSGPAAMLMTPFLRYMAREHPGIEVDLFPGATELQLTQLRERLFDALVIEMRRITPAPDLVIEPLIAMRTGFICRAGHPLLALGGEPASAALPFAALRHYPLASTPLSPEAARILVDLYGPNADPQTAVSVRCDDITSLIDTVRATDAIFIGIVAAARAGIAAGPRAELPVSPPLTAGARFAFVTLAGRTEAPSMAIFRRFAEEHLRD